ncbi:MAG: hypothetical protein QOF06_1845 [Solirubrobacterales bacterium]|jgi:hypothetical protein|nr:hypothetical protein [Solirubrobacterales bacterium]
MHGRRPVGPICATRAIIALVVAVACLGSVAYAATRPDVADRKAGDSRPGRPRGERPPRPRFIEVPASAGVLTDVQIRFHVAPPAQQPADSGPGPAPAPATGWRRFQCRFESGDWEGCSSPRRFAGLEPGDHAFAVRALNRRGLPGPAAHYSWAQLEPKAFTIDPVTDSLAELLPGDPAQQLPLRIDNPNPAPIEVTALSVSVTPDPAGCPADPNFAVMPASVSVAAPLVVPAGGTVSLPNATASAPTLALRELSSDQNACQGATVHLVFSGVARG